MQRKVFSILSVFTITCFLLSLAPVTMSNAATPTPTIGLPTIGVPNGPGSDITQYKFYVGHLAYYNWGTSPYFKYGWKTVCNTGDWQAGMLYWVSANAGFSAGSYERTGAHAAGYGFVSPRTLAHTMVYDSGTYQYWGANWHKYGGWWNGSNSYIADYYGTGPKKALTDLGYPDLAALTISFWNEDNNPAFTYFGHTAFNTTWGDMYPIISLCYGTNPFPRPAPEYGGTLLLQDGGMDQLPISDYWYNLYDQSFSRNEFGRIDTSNIFNGLAYGPAKCGAGMQIIGNASGFLAKSGHFADIAQGFELTQSTARLYYRYSAKSSSQAAVKVSINGLTNDGSFGETVLDNKWVGPIWTDKVGYVDGPFSPGRYVFNIQLTSVNVFDSWLAIDDVVLATGPISANFCGEYLLSPPTPTGTLPTSTITPKSVTVTPTLTPYPTGTPGANVIRNCGFGLGEQYWYFTGGSYVVYDAIAAEGNYAYVPINNGAYISQDFYWSGGVAFFKWTARNSYAWNVSVTNRSTGAFYQVSRDQYTGGDTTRKATVNLPAGPYTVKLGQFDTRYGSAYDEITVNYGSYGDCWSPQPAPGQTATSTPRANYTPTARPTATNTGVVPTLIPSFTALPTHTQQPTSTSVVGQPTPTAQKTFTPYPTYTPWPSFTPYKSPYPTITPEPFKSPTPYPTYTPQPTFTPLPTYTPDANGTIPPSPTPSTTPPVPPPPSYYADCNRPTNADPSWWMEYEKCQILSFWVMSPNAVSTSVAIPTMFAGKEPFGTLGEVRDTEKGISDLVNQYDWENTGLPGTRDKPNLDQFINEPGADSPLNGGKFDFSKHYENPNMTCDTKMSRMFGSGMGKGMCWLFNLLRQLGIMAWLQVIVDIGAVAFLLVYLWKKWIDAGTGGGD